MKKGIFFGLSITVLMLTGSVQAEEFDFLGVEDAAPILQPVQPKGESMVPQGFTVKSKPKMKTIEMKAEPIKNKVSKVEPDITDTDDKDTDLPDAIDEQKEEGTEIEADIWKKTPSFLEIDKSSTENDYNEDIGEYITDFENANSARESATDLLAHQPQKLLIKIKPKLEKIEEPVKEQEDEEPETVVDDKIISVLSDGKKEAEEPISSDEIPEIKAEDTEIINDSATEIKEETKVEVSEQTETPVADETEKPKEEQKASVQQKAPFDFIWGSSKQEVEATGAVFEATEREGYQNVWRLKSGPQQSNNFAEITLIFGKQDKLWCIYAESQPQDDDAQASKVLALYHKYYDALNKKYGHGEEFFTPFEYSEKQTDENGAEITVKKFSTIGGEKFLEELAEEKSALYATFYNDEIGATLSVAADGEQSYLILDYKNLPLMNEEKKEKISEMLEGLEGL